MKTFKRFFFQHWNSLIKINLRWLRFKHKKAFYQYIRNRILVIICGILSIGFCLGFAINYGLNHIGKPDIGQTVSTKVLNKNENTLKPVANKKAVILNVINNAPIYSFKSRYIANKKILKQNFAYSAQKLQSISFNRLQDAYYLDPQQAKNIYFEHNTVLTFNKDNREGISGNNFYDWHYGLYEFGDASFQYYGTDESAENLLYKDSAEDGNKVQKIRWHSKYHSFSYADIMNPANFVLRQAHLNDYDYQTLLKHEWHPVTYSKVKKAGKLNPVIYYQIGKFAYYLPLVKIRHNYYYQLRNGYYIKASDVTGINNHKLSVYNAPLTIKFKPSADSVQATYQQIEQKDPYNYRLNYGYLNNQKADNAIWPVSRVIDETKYVKRLNGKVANSIAIQNVIEQNKKIDAKMTHLTHRDYKRKSDQTELDAEGSVPKLINGYYYNHYNNSRFNQKNQYLNLQKQRLLNTPAQNNLRLVLNRTPNFLPNNSQKLAQHLLVKSFGYTNLDPKPTNPFSRVFVGDNDLTPYTTDNTDDPLHYGKLIPDCYIQDGKKREWINMHESSQHEVSKSGIGGYLKTTYWNYATPAKGLYLKFGIGDGKTPAKIRYPFNKTLYVQSIIRNSIKGRNHEFYLIARYNQKTNNGYREWTYPIMNTSDVKLSNIVKHKRIVTHYNNFLDTSIFTYHMMDFERYNHYDYAYRFIHDSAAQISKPFEEIGGTPDSKDNQKAIMDALLPSVDTAQDNLNNENGNLIVSKVSTKNTTQRIHFKKYKTVDDIFNSSHNLLETNGY